MSRPFAPIPDNFEPTRATLHQYAHAVGVVPRAHAEPHDKWWHISLNVTPRGLETNEMALTDGGRFNVRLDLQSHEAVIEANGAAAAQIPLGAGMTATEMGDAILQAVSELGLDAEYARDKFESDEAREYDAAAATDFHGILLTMHEVFQRHRNRIGDRVSPIQVWPHGFDMAFEWFGTRIEEYEEDGEVQQHPSQCNFGFYPAGRAYLYANPWPFESDTLLDVDLPAGAEWHSEGWQGSILHYDQLAGDPDGEQRVLDFFQAVFDVAAPTLTA